MDAIVRNRERSGYETCQPVFGSSAMLHTCDSLLVDLCKMVFAGFATSTKSSAMQCGRLLASGISLRGQM